MKPEERVLDEGVKTFVSSLKTSFRTFKAGRTYSKRRHPLGKVFVKLVVLPAAELRTYLEEHGLGSSNEAERLQHVFQRAAAGLQHIDISDIFSAIVLSSEGDSVRILLVGNAGVGKTTLSRYCALQWAEGQHWQHFTIVVFLELRSKSVRQSTGIIELFDLKSHEITDKAEQASIVDFVKKRPERVCLILDGLDEVNLDDCSTYVQDIIHGEKLPGIRLLVTSRHTKESYNLGLTFNRRIEVLGFDKEGTRQFVRHMLDTPDAAKMIEELDDNSQLDNMMSSPLFATMTCDMYRTHHKLPSCLTDVILALVTQLAQRQVTSHDATIVYADFHELPCEMKEPILELGGFAFRMLSEKKLTPTEEDLRRYKLSDAARRLGLLVACNPAETDEMAMWTFGHLAIQEGIAALFCSTTCSQPEHALWLFRTLGPTSVHLDTFWIMYAAQLYHHSLCSLIQGILEKQATATDLESTKAAVTHYLFASDSILSGLVEDISSLLDRDKMEHLADELLSGKVPGPGSQFVESQMPQRSSVKNVDYMKTVLRTWLSKVPYANRIILEKAIASVDSSASLVLRETSSEERNVSMTSADQPRSLADSTTDAGKRQLLLACHCYSESTKHHKSQQAVPALHNWIKTHRSIGFPSILLSQSDCHAISRVLQDYQPVAIVNLEECNLDDVCMSELLPGLQACRKLTNLVVTNNKLTSIPMMDIVDVIHRNATSLVEVSLFYNHQLTPEVVMAIGSAVGDCTKMKWLAIDGCNLPDVNVAMCHHILTRCHQLLLFGFVQGALRKADIEELVPCLSALKLNQLIFGANGFTSECCHSIDQIIHNQCNQLEQLSLRVNPIGDAGLRDIIQSLRSCTRLTVLNLISTSLSSESLPLLASLLRQCTQIQQLYLCYENDFSGSEPPTADSFADSVLTHGSLRILWMPARDRVYLRLQQQLDEKKTPRLELVYK